MKDLLGGTAGNVVAGRLAENPDVSVLVVEAGPGNPRDEPMITTPARAMELRGSKYDWGTGYTDPKSICYGLTLEWYRV